MQTERIKELIAARIEARRVVERAEKMSEEANQAEFDALFAIKERIREIGREDLLELWTDAKLKQENAAGFVSGFKKSEKEAEEALRAEVEREAVFLQVQGKDVYGRGFHPNINITKEFAIELPQNPYELGAVVTELAKKGLRESLTITVRGFTDKFRDTVFESPLLKRETPQVKLDAANKWPTE